MTRLPNLLLVVFLAVTWDQGHTSQVWRCVSSDSKDPYMDKLCRERCVPGKCQSYCVCSMTEVVHSCASFDFAPNDIISIDETIAPGTQIFSIPINGQESWAFNLQRSGSVDGSLWRELKSYFNFKKFGQEYEMIVDRTPDLEKINLQYNVQLSGLGFSLTCSSPGLPDETRELLVLVKSINEFAPQFIGLPLTQTVPENTPIGYRVFTMAKVTIDRDVNPSRREISVFQIHEYKPKPSGAKNSSLDSQAYFEMTDIQKGYIAVKEKLDYEALSAIGATRFVLNISASDIHGWVSYTTLQIDVTDINDLPPEFTHPSCPSHIPRSRPCPVSFETTIKPGYKGPLRHILPVSIQARDMDSIGDDVILSLDKGPGELAENAAKFSINQETGDVTLESPFPKPIEIDLVVVAKENSSLGRTTQAPLKVYVKTINAIHPARSPGSTNSPNNTVRIVNSKGGGDVDNLILLIIIGVLSGLVLIFIVIVICVICSIKKDNNAKNKVSPVNNMTFTDHPSSYRYSQDPYNTDDDVGNISEMDSYISKKSTTKPYSVTFSPEEATPNNQKSRSTSSPHRSSRSSNSSGKGVPRRSHIQNNNHRTWNGHPTIHGSLPIDCKSNRSDHQLQSQHINVLGNIQSKVPVYSHEILKEQQSIAAHIDSIPEENPIAQHWRQSIPANTSQSNVTHSSQRSSSHRSRKSKSSSNANNIMEMEAQLGQSMDEKSTTILKNQRNRQRNEVDSREGNLSNMSGKREKHHATAATGRRIRIPSGVLIVKQPVSREESETSGPDSEGNSLSDVFQDNSSGCGDATTPASSTDKPQTQFQMAPPSMTDVLSILPMEHSSGISEDNLSAKSNLLAGSKSKHTSSPMSGHNNPDLDYTTVPQTTTTDPVNDIHHGERAHIHNKHDTLENSKINYANSNDVHSIRKPAKLPALEIPGNANLLRRGPNSHRNGDRAYSEDIINRRLGEFTDTPEAEMARCRSLGDDTNSLARRKKRRRRALIREHRENYSNRDGQRDNGVMGRQGEGYGDPNSTAYQ